METALLRLRASTMVVSVSYKAKGIGCFFPSGARRAGGVLSTPFGARWRKDASSSRSVSLKVEGSRIARWLFEVVVMFRA